MADEDIPYKQWVRRQRCCACGGIPPSEPHHHTEGENAVRPTGKQLGGKRGLGQRAHDERLMPLCWKCHRHIADFSGPFKGMSKAERGEWQTKQAREHRERYEAEIATLPVIEEKVKEAVRRDGGPFMPEGVGLDVPSYASRFAVFYELAPQAEHDLQRLLKRVAKEAGARR